jgi:hypothetical protein
VEDLLSFMDADYCVQVEIRDSIEKKYLRNYNQPFAAHIAYQITLYYWIGFGVKSDDAKAHIWLQKSNHLPVDWNNTTVVMRPARRSGRMRGFNALALVNLIHEYQAR